MKRHRPSYWPIPRASPDIPRGTARSSLRTGARLPFRSATSNSCPKPDAIAWPTPLRRSPPHGNTPYTLLDEQLPKYYVDVMQREVALFVSIGLVILVVFLWVAFQSIWGVCIPLLVVLLSGLWTLGTMEMTGKSIDVMTIVLPTIIFVVGISDVVHILSRYYEELRRGASQFQGIQAAFKELGWPRS